MTEEELNLFLIKSQKLKSKNMMVLDSESKGLIDRMNEQYSNHKKKDKFAKKQKTASIFYPGV